jgi:hypothetical protein
MFLGEEHGGENRSSKKRKVQELKTSSLIGSAGAKFKNLK